MPSFQFHLNVEGFLDTLPVMGFGMLGVFLVMFLIYLSIVILLAIFGNKKTQKENN